jgi:hypothetical protein
LGHLGRKSPKSQWPGRNSLKRARVNKNAIRLFLSDSIKIRRPGVALAFIYFLGRGLYYWLLAGFTKNETRPRLAWPVCAAWVARIARIAPLAALAVFGARLGPWTCSFWNPARSRRSSIPGIRLGLGRQFLESGSV